MGTADPATATARALQVLCFEAAGERYALGSLAVVEVVPRVVLRPVPSGPEALAGMLDYRGRVVPVVDLCRLLGHGSCPDRMSSRIAVLDLVVAGAASPADPPSRHRVGLLAERMLRVARLDPAAEGSHPGPRDEASPALGRIVRHEGGMLRLVHAGDLLPPEVLDALHDDEAPGGRA